MAEVQTLEEAQRKMAEDGYVDLSKNIGQKISGNSGFSLAIADEKRFASLYTGDGLTKRYIDLLVDDMTRQWIEIEGDSDGKVLDYMKSLRAKTEFKNALRCSKLFGGSIIFMVIDDGQEPNEPVNINNIKSINKLKHFSRKCVTVDPENYYKDISSASFDEPEYFTITANGASQTVHESRCLVFNGDYYPQEELGITANYEKFWGISILQSLHEILEDYGLAQQAIMKLLTKCNIDVLKIKNLMKLLATKDGQKQVDARLQTFDLAKSISNTLLLDNDEDFTVVAQTLTGFADVFAKLQDNIAAMTGVPSNVLFGTSPKGLNATGDNEMRIYYDKVKSDQEEEMLPQLERLLSYISFAKDNSITEKDLSIVFNSLWQMSEKEKTELRHRQAQTDEVYIANGVVDPNEIRQSRFGGEHYSIETKAEGELDLPDFGDEEPKEKDE